MSSDLDKELRTQVIDAARDGRGRIVCACCGREVAGKGFQIDHRRPEIDGGAKHDPDNLQVLCVRKDGTGCHQVKTKREATARAAKRRALEISPHKRARPYALVGTGLAAVAYSYTQMVYGTEAADDVMALAKGGTGLVLLLLIADNVVRSLRTAPPPEKKQKASEADGATADEARREAITRRLKEAMTEVIVKGEGEVTVSDVVVRGGTLISFVVGYAGTKFPARNDDRCIDVLEQVSTEIGGRWNPEWTTTAQKVRFTRRNEPPKRIPHPGFEGTRPWHQIPIAPGMTLDFLVTSHILIAGATNAGKTSLIRALIAALCDSAARGEVELILVDPKQIELLGFATWPGVTGIRRTDEAMWLFATDLAETMHERYRLLADEGVPLNSHKPIVVLLDEYKNFVSRMKTFFMSGKAPIKYKTGIPNPPMDSMEQVLSMARKCGIHLILATQSPYASWFGGGSDGVRQNLEGRVLVGHADVEVSKMMFARRVGGDIPASAKGRATVQNGDGPVVEVQTFWVPDPADSDPHYDNTVEDWEILLRVGMPEAMLPEAMKEKVSV